MLTNILISIRDALRISALRLFGKLRRTLIGPYGIAVLCASENALLLAPADDLTVARKLCFGGSYDPELLSFFLNKCVVNSDVLFVGAHVGAFVLPVAKCVRRVAAVEANPMILDLLRKNVMLNGLQNVEVHGVAAGDRNDEVGFLSYSLNSGGSGLELGERKKRRSRSLFSDASRRIVVPMRRLDDLFPDPHFDFIVMDIEGAEHLALRGMSNILKRSCGLLIEISVDHLRATARISNDQFLAQVSPFFDEAIIFPERQQAGTVAFSAPYHRSEFPEMMKECCRLRLVNVMFWRKAGSDAERQVGDPVYFDVDPEARLKDRGAKVHEDCCRS